MLKNYGSRLCPDCVRCLSDLARSGVEYEYRDFGEDLSALKEFLAIRDSDPQLAEVKAKCKIGIPCIVDQDGSVRLDW